MGSRGWIVAMGLLVVALPSPVRADQTPVPTATPSATPSPTPTPTAIPRPSATTLHVEYSAPGNCPTESDFETRVHARTELARFADDPDARTVQIVVRPMGFTYAGHLSILGRSGFVRDRDVEDTLCSDVVDALALVLAFAVDNAARLASPALPATRAFAAAPALPPAPARAPAPVPTNAIPLLEPRAELALPEPDTRHQASPSGMTVSLGAGFFTTSSAAPDALVGGGAFGELEPRASGWLAPSARLTLLAGENGAFVTRTASFLLISARPDVCPVRLGSAAASLRACLAVNVGALRGVGIDIAHPTPVVSFWLDASLLFRARWAPGRRWFFAEAEGGLVVPATRPTFVYADPIARVYQPPSAAAVGSLAMGVRFR
jgi:hypothetical protein